MRSLEEIKRDFLDDLNNWQSIVHKYDLLSLKKQPDSNQWSIGQVIDHFIVETGWYFSQARKALVDTQNLQKPKSPTIAEWFATNSFPDERFKGPEDMDEPKQPKSIYELVDKLESIKKDMMVLANTILKSASKGKTEHPGHQFLTAHEWLQYAEMHCRHHFRQKKRIDTTIKKTNK